MGVTVLISACGDSSSITGGGDTTRSGNSVIVDGFHSEFEVNEPDRVDVFIRGSHTTVRIRSHVGILELSEPNNTVFISAGLNVQNLLVDSTRNHIVFGENVVVDRCTNNGSNTTAVRPKSVRMQCRNVGSGHGI